MNVFFTELPIAYSLLTILCIGVCVYLWTFTKWHYWKVRGVPYLSPVYPIFGNMYDLLFLRSLPDITNRIYQETKGLPYIGIYAFNTPVFFVRNLDLAASIFIKDFSHFQDRGFSFNTGDTLGRNLIHQSGSDWQYFRAKLAPCFNLSKVKSMLPTMKNKCESFVNKLENEELKQKYVEVWDASLRYTTDVVTSCTHGIDVNSLKEEHELFRENGRHMLGVYFIYHVFVGCFFPWLHRIMKISVAKARVTAFFRTVTRQVIDHRQDNWSARKDVMHTLLQLKEDAGFDELNKQIPEIDDNVIAAQAFIFFLAGFEAPGTVLGCSLFEVAKNPEIQENICLEIERVLGKYGGEVTFDALQDMKYLRQVVSEALRKYAPLSLIFRRCTEDYTVPGTSHVIEKGTLVLFPLRSVHKDPEYYPDPATFDPQRFSDVNSSQRHIAAYMPFGLGPRFCPAVLYSHTKIKAALVYVLRRFRVSPTSATPPQIQPSPTEFLMAPRDGIPLTFTRRDKEL